MPRNNDRTDVSQIRGVNGTSNSLNNADRPGTTKPEPSNKSSPAAPKRAPEVPVPMPK